MRIASKFWLCITALILGYLATVALNSILSRRNEGLLNRTAETVFPAAQAAQAAQAEFKRQLQSYQDAIVLGESEALNKAQATAEDVRLRLERLSGDASLDTGRRQQALALHKDLNLFSLQALTTYGRIAQGESADNLPAEAAALDAIGNKLLSRMDELARDLSTDLQRIIATTIEATVRQRVVSEIAFVLIVVTILTVIAVIIARWARRLDSLMEASQRLTQGDYGCELASKGTDEVGQLARAFEGMRSAVRRRDKDLRSFNEGLESLVAERTHELVKRSRELEDRNDDLAEQIAERRRAEQSLKLLDEAVNQIPEAVIISTAEADLGAQQLAYNNPGFRALMRSEAAATGAPPSLIDLCCWQEHQESCPLSRLIAEVRLGNAGNCELQATLHNGERFLDVHAAPVRADNGEVTHMVYIIHDITERRVLESQRSQGQKLESIGQLAAGVAHEINTPIQFIGDNLRFLQDSFTDLTDLLAAYAALRLEQSAAADCSRVDAAVAKADLDYLNQEIPNALGQSLEGVGRVASIIRALKEFSHPDADVMQANDLGKAIESTLIVARNEYKYVADLVTDLSAELPLVECQIGQINQVILNMVVNASHAISDVVKDSGTRGTISIATRQLDDWVEIRISDTGSGMPDAVKQRIFEPFFTTKAVGKGTGQGLYIAHDIIVKKHHGTIAVESGCGIGTTFVLRIPLVQTPAIA